MSNLTPKAAEQLDDLRWTLDSYVRDFDELESVHRYADNIVEVKRDVVIENLKVLKSDIEHLANLIHRGE